MTKVLEGLSFLFIGELELRALGAEHGCGVNTLLLHSREAACENSLADEGKRNTLVECGDARPFTRALLTCGVEYLINDRLAVLVAVGEDIAGYLDEVAVELALVPLCKHG